MHHSISVTLHVGSNSFQYICLVSRKLPENRQKINRVRKSKQFAGHLNKTVLLRISSLFPELSLNFQIDIPLLPKLPCFVTVSYSHIYTSFELRKSEINGVLLGVWQIIMGNSHWELPANDGTRWQIRFRWGLEFSLF